MISTAPQPSTYPVTYRLENFMVSHELLGNVPQRQSKHRSTAMTTLELEGSERLLSRQHHRSLLLGLLVLASIFSTASCFVIKRIKNEGSLSSTPIQPCKLPSLQRNGSGGTMVQSLATSTGVSGSTTITPDDRGSDLQDLKASIDIVEVVESYNLPKFRRTGTGATACCPFHDDTNPSMSIDATRQRFKCFSCGEGGDVLNFVQKYSTLQGQEELSFGQVLQILDSEFGDGTFTTALSSERKFNIPPEIREKERLRKERCLLANAAAASFFSDTLTRVSSGAARLYLRSRGLSARTIRMFALGFASNDRKGLCKHLRELNFTAAEVVDAGLAIVSKKIASSTNSSGTHDNLTYNDIMDKFNDRVIVPIVDDTGKKVLGFGGRTISSEKEDIIQFKGPKYLNSPETPLFSKSNILFGRFSATKAINDVTSQSSKRPTIVVVEGYMDAILLWEAGYQSVVATMGTAVSQSQLDNAARAVAGTAGRVVLCLDSDKAGIAAVERLCSNGMVAASAKKFKVDVLIASMPDGLKDPGEFAAMHQSNEDFFAKFEKEVVNDAEDWISWYTLSIIQQYKRSAPRGARNSFSDIFSKVAEFIGTTMDTADRTKAALDLSHHLSELLKTDRNSTEISKTVQIQLEADLIDLAARNSYSRNALSQRVEEISMVPPDSKESKITLSNLLKGDLLTADINTKPKGNIQSPARSNDKSAFRRVRPINKTRKITTMKRSKRAEVSLTPFFSGFEFRHKSDAEWLSGSSHTPRWKVSYCLLFAHY